VRLSVHEQIKGLGDTISSAQWHFDVWEALDEARVSSQNLAVLNKYLEFFQATRTANFESYIISCYQLFETRSDTISFPQLKHELKSTLNFDVDSDPEAANVQATLKPIWKNICTLRNKSVGHLTIKKSIEEVYLEANLKPEQIRQFIDGAKKLINIVTYRLNQSRDAFGIRGKDSVNKLLADLRGLL
jgi:hypothetical protein